MAASRRSEAEFQDTHGRIRHRHRNKASYFGVIKGVDSFSSPAAAILQAYQAATVPVRRLPESRPSLSILSNLNIQTP